MGSGAAYSSRAEGVGSSRPDWLALSLLGLAVALAVFLLVPPFLRGQVGTTPGFTGQEAADLLTPIVTMPLLVLAFEFSGRSGTRTRFISMLLIAAWVAGQAIHLGANAIGDVFPEGPARDAFYQTDAGKLDFFLDEVLSHWLWHLAWVGLLLLLLWVGGTGPRYGARAGRGVLGVAGVAGAVHGLTWAIVTVEGDTWTLGLPAAAVLLVLALLVRGRSGSWRVITTFLAISAVATLVLYAGWVAYAGWPPLPPCEVITCS